MAIFVTEICVVVRYFTRKYRHLLKKDQKASQHETLSSQSI